MSTELTVQQRETLVKNLKLELNDRISRLKSHHQIMARALRARIELRINRIPKRLWNKTLREIRQEQMERDINGDQAYHAATASAPSVVLASSKTKVAGRPAEKITVAKRQPLVSTKAGQAKSPTKSKFQSPIKYTANQSSAKSTMGRTAKTASTKATKASKSASKTTLSSTGPAKVAKPSATKRTVSAAKRAMEKVSGAASSSRRNLRSRT